VVLGKFSEQAAEAAECAREQAKFWEYHDKLFATDPGLGFTHSNLKKFALQLKLNPATAAAALGARGTPTFFVNSRFVVGGQPFEVFRQVIEKELESNAVERKRKK
jgi:protein-disulfide isomerase